MAAGRSPVPLGDQARRDFPNAGEPFPRSRRGGSPSRGPPPPRSGLGRPQPAGIGAPTAGAFPVAGFPRPERPAPNLRDVRSDLPEAPPIGSPLRPSGGSSRPRRDGAAAAAGRRSPAGPRYDPEVLRAVLFDFNGVLVDDEPIHLELFQRVLGEEGIALPADDYYARYLGLDDRACFAAVLAAAGETATVPRLMRLTARKASYYQERVRREGYPFAAGAAGLVRGLAARRLDARRGDRRPARGGRGGAAAGGAARPLQGAGHRRGRERGQAGPRGVRAGPGGPQLAAARCRSACSTPTRCSPSRTARWASPPPPRWACRRSASPAPTPATGCAARTPSSRA